MKDVDENNVKIDQYLGTKNTFLLFEWRHLVRM